jgi:bifunctional non-homologous end joining protein LigD
VAEDQERSHRRRPLRRLEPRSGRRAGTIGTLLVGVSTPDGLAYIGNVGTGFTDAAVRDLRGRLTALEILASPFDAVPVPTSSPCAGHWVKPNLGGEIGLEGRLRHPRWRGLREG